MAVNIPTAGLMLGFQLASIIAILVSVFCRNWTFFTIAMLLVAGTLIGSYFVPRSSSSASGGGGSASPPVDNGEYGAPPESLRHLQQDGEDNFENDMWQGDVPSHKYTRPDRPRPAPASSLPQRKGFETHMYTPFTDVDQAKAAYNAPYGIDVETPPVEDVNAFQEMMLRGKLGGNTEYMQEVFE